MSVETWKSFFDLATVLLLFLTFAAGAGVLVTGNIINRRQSVKLNQFDADLTDAKTELAKQQERAAKAEARIASADQHAAEANAKAEGFRADIAKANASAAQAEAQVADAHRAAAEANKIAESERLARLQLEARLADRVITPDQQQRITSAFTPLKGQTIDVVVVGDSLEITKTSNTIINSIHKAGVLLTFTHPLGEVYAQGVIVGVRADEPNEIKQASDLLIGILRESLDGGVGQDDFDRIQVTMTGTTGNDQGAAPRGTSPLRLLIAPK